MGAGPKPGGLLFAFLVSDRSPRIMSFASAEWRNLSDGPQGTPTPHALTPPARGFAGRRDGC